MSEIKEWTQEHHDIATDAMSEGGSKGALGEIFANTYFVDHRVCQDVATRAMSELKQAQDTA